MNPKLKKIRKEWTVNIMILRHMAGGRKFKRDSYLKLVFLDWYII